jgi:hypothetical protein
MNFVAKIIEKLRIGRLSTIIIFIDATIRILFIEQMGIRNLAKIKTWLYYFNIFQYFCL